MVITNYFHPLQILKTTETIIAEKFCQQIIEIKIKPTTACISQQKTQLLQNYNVRPDVSQITEQTLNKLIMEFYLPYHTLLTLHQRITHFSSILITFKRPLLISLN